ncbi:uncharacterized protein LOC131077793 [Cryptomeria japonica]|uniref:uncharacterized protein LOC131077793 n=1 Tax=Cryptomeria japonica TaxID=3369 RepID=UPI0027DA64C6|nr:uncharacterized protein LOC131077793 [Cryptomeria japonica]
MEEQDTGGDQTPHYSQVYDNLQQLQYHNFNLQQQHEIAPFNGASYYSGHVPFNGESHNNNNHYFQEQAQRQTLQQEQFQMVPQTQLQMMPQTHIQTQTQQQQQQPSMEMEIQKRQQMNMKIQRVLLQRQQRSEQCKNVNMNEVSQSIGRPINLRKHADNPNELLNDTLPLENQNVDLQQQNQNVDLQLQQQNQNGNVHLHHQQHDINMQFQQWQNTEMENQQVQLLQQHNLEQSNNVNVNVNVNVISQSTEIDTVSQPIAPPIAPPDREKRKRGRPRKLSNQADNRASKLPLGSTKTPPDLQFEHGEPGLFRVIVIAPGEDVHEKIMSFYQHSPLTVCIISAKGTISNVDFQEFEPRRIVNHKGEFEILSLSRSYTKDNNGLRVALIHLDGTIFRGIVGGLLIAASFVEVVVGVFSSDAVYIPGQVGDKGPISISGQPNTEVYSAISDV